MAQTDCWLQKAALILHPWILLTTVTHEFGHALMVIFTGGRVFTIHINLSGSGDTIWIPRKVDFVSRREYFVWATGYTFAGLVGAYLVFSGFSILAVSLELRRRLACCSLLISSGSLSFLAKVEDRYAGDDSPAITSVDFRHERRGISPDDRVRIAQYVKPSLLNLSIQLVTRQ